MLKKIIFLTYYISIGYLGLAQNNTDNTQLSKNETIKVYIDCNSCDIQYFKENFTFINYVRDRKESDVQIIITQMETGSGGVEYSLQFIGRNRFKQISDTLKFSLPTDYTKDEARSEMLRQIQLGLIPYLIKTPFAKRINLSFNDKEKVKNETDPWKYWVFKIHSRGYGQKEKSYSNISINNGFSVQKITPDIKIEFYFNNNYNASKYRLYDGDSLVYKSDVYQRSYYFSWLVVKSFGEHWGLGGYINFTNSTYNNYNLQININPAVEYNVFKYSEATRKQLRIMYSIGYRYNDYIDTTIYNKIKDNMIRQRISLMFKYVAKWGSLNANISSSDFINKPELYNISGYLGMSVRLFKGFSIDFWGNFELPHDQISLRKGVTTPEEILTRQHEMQSNYSFWLNGGISYTFGSIYNNVVNPRFN